MLLTIVMVIASHEPAKVEYPVDRQFDSLLNAEDGNRPMKGKIFNIQHNAHVCC